VERDITAEEVRELLTYDPTTGVFVWRESRGSAKVGDVAGRKAAGYQQIKIARRLYGSHRLAWLWVKGVWPEQELDHINGVKDDNRMVNLRAVTHGENQKNRKQNVNNTSGVTGVSWVSGRRKWQACIKVNGRSKTLGLFNDIGEATAVRQQAEVDHGFHTNHGRA